MNTSRQTESAREGVTPQSLSSRSAQRFHGWLRVTAAVLALTALTVLPAQAGVEYVTTTGDCTKVWTTADPEFSIIAGPNIRFRVFGNSIDFDNGFSFETSSNSTARIVSRGTNCGDLNNTGFALVEVDSPLTATFAVTLKLNFTMPLGNISSLEVTIKPYPSFDVTWETIGGVSPIPCITKTGEIVQNGNVPGILYIFLPAGHQEDQTNCNQRTLGAIFSNSDLDSLDIGPVLRYSVTGVPTFMTSSLNSAGRLSFSIDVARIRALTTRSYSEIVVRSPNPDRTHLLILEVEPNLSNGFTQAANCRNSTTGAMVDIDDLVVCELRLAKRPPAAGLLIPFQVQDRLCVKAGAPNVTYSSASGIGSITLPETAGTIFGIPLRALGGTTSAGAPCASDTGVQGLHTVKFWIGQRISAGGGFSSMSTEDTFRIRQPKR